MTETIIMCAVLSIIVFCSQAILCLKAKQKTVKLIPGYIIVAVYAICIILWFIDLFGDKVKTSELSIILHMFSGNGVEYIPFDINGKSDKQIAANNVFADCLNLKAIPKITANVSDVSYIFSNCKRLRELSEDAVANIDWSYIDSLTAPYSGARNATFNCCNSLRKFPMSFLKHGNPLAAYSVSIYNNCFYINII